jgi:O-antigen ligase
VGVIFVGVLLVYICIAALYKPHVGLIGYFGWVILKPEYLWAWALPKDLGLQKYIAIVTLFGWVIKGFPGNSLRRSSLFGCIGLLIYLVLSWVSSFQSRDPIQTAFFMSVIWKIVLMTILAARLLDTNEKVIALMWVTVLAQGFNAYEINRQYLRDGYSWALLNGWSFNDSNTYSIATVPIMAFSASLAIFSRYTWQRVLATTIFILQLHQIFLLESRGCMLGLVVLGAILWRKMPKTPQKWAITVVVLGLVSILAGPPVVKEFSSIFVGADQRDASAESRFLVWKAGWDITKDYPLLGLGPWGVETTVPYYYPGGLKQERKALHNLPLDLTAGSGVPAAIGYLAFYLLPWFSLRRYWRQNQVQFSDKTRLGCVAVFAALPGYWISSFFSSGLLLESGYLFAAVTIAMLSIAHRDFNVKFPTKSNE